MDMPNNCDNLMKVKGSKPAIDNFIQQITRTRIEDDGTENTFIDIAHCVKPIPEDLQITSGSFGFKDDGSPSEQQLAYDRLYAQNKEKYGFSDWYGWSNANYGTKWGDYEGVIERDSDNQVTYTFTTAWAPFNESFMEYFAEKFPELNVVYVYSELGMNFMGCYILAEGDGVIYNADSEIPDIEESLNDDGEPNWEEHYEKVSEAISNYYEFVRTIAPF
jgi:hypothetical protein